MKLEKADLQVLRWPLIGLAASVIFGGLIAAAGFFFLQGAQKHNKISTAQRAESQGKLARAAQEEQELRQKITRFIDLERRGYVGPEERLGWIEQIARLARDYKLQEFRYELLPQKTADALLLPDGASAGSHVFQQSTQRFSAKILHEGDLIAFINALRRQVPAYIVVRNCLITRLPPDPAETRLVPLLSANCDLDWIKLSEAK